MGLTLAGSCVTARWRRGLVHGNLRIWKKVLKKVLKLLSPGSVSTLLYRDIFLSLFRALHVCYPQSGLPQNVVLYFL